MVSKFTRRCPYPVCVLNKTVWEDRVDSLCPANVWKIPVFVLIKYVWSETDVLNISPVNVDCVVLRVSFVAVKLERVEI
jgi:hypothetical protein